MKKKIWSWVGFASIVALVLSFGGVGNTLMAAPGDYSYQIQVVKDGQPLPGAIVRLAGVGVEMTDNIGIASFGVSDAPGRGQGRQELFRGPLFAAAKGKVAGAVVDEYNVMRIIVSSHDIDENPGNAPSFTMGTEIFIKLNTIYVLSVD